MASASGETRYSYRGFSINGCIFGLVRPLRLIGGLPQRHWRLELLVGKSGCQEAEHTRAPNSSISKPARVYNSINKERPSIVY